MTALRSFTMTFTNDNDNNNNNMDTTQEDTLATIEVMLHQEATGYMVSDYLQQIEPQTTTYAHGPLTPPPVDASCRSLMAQWCNSVVDACSYSRETTTIAMNFLDRFVSKDSQILYDRTQFQLAVMACLYTTAKIHETCALEPESVATLSRGLHSKEDVEQMESRMLHAIQWRVNPPTAMAFVRALLDLFPAMDSTTQKTICDLANYQIDLAVCDYDLSRNPASSTAFASLLNAIESVDAQDGRFSVYFASMASQILKIDLTRIQKIRMRLYEAVSRESDSPMCAFLTTKGKSGLATRISSLTTASPTCNQSSPRAVSMSI
jgi:hypothetical protein